MNVHASNLSAKSRIPVERILEARVSFPHCSLSFEVEFEAEELTDLSDLVVLFARIQLTCDSLRYYGKGTVLARFCDSERANFRLKDAVLAQSTSLRLVRWTTVLSKSGD